MEEQEEQILGGGGAENWNVGLRTCRAAEVSRRRDRRRGRGVGSHAPGAAASGDPPPGERPAPEGRRLPEPLPLRCKQAWRRSQWPGAAPPTAPSQPLAGAKSPERQAAWQINARPLKAKHSRSQAALESGKELRRLRPGLRGGSKSFLRNLS